MTTPLDILAEALRDCRKYASGAEAPPEAILWSDAGEEFTPIVPALRARLPNLLTFGPYDPATRTGPALWLRAATARQVAGIEWPAGEPAIIYFPARGRDVLRGAEDCPAELAPLVWFAVAGNFFGQPKQSRDWTLRGFLAAQGSPVSLEIPEDKATREALGRAARRLFDEELTDLKGRRLDAAALDGLLVPDLDADMLKWIDGNLSAESDPERFAAFAALATKQLGFDPRKKSRQDAAARLAQGEKRWAKVWDRFEDRDGAYEGVVKLLCDETPQSMFEGRSAYPKVNEAGEEELRKALLALDAAGPEKAAAAVLELEQRHGWRRDAVWARRGEARLAQALEHLAVVAQAPALPSHDAQMLADAYLAEGWKADWAAMRVLDIARTGADRDAVTAALRAIYLPWAEAGAVALQELAQNGKVAFAKPIAPPAPPNRAALLFADGLRLDLAQQLAALLRARGAAVELRWAWSGFPTVTATCKPLASPAAGLLSATAGEGLIPQFEGKPVQKPVLLKAIETAGWSTAETLLDDKPLWGEVGRFDERGHALGADLATQARDLLQEVADIALKLAQRGRKVRIVTDHGWLLMAGGLPQAPLVAGLTVAGGKGHRVATLKEGAPTTYPRFPWSWGAGVMLATPTGARAFYSGVEYAHGGVSPQECILPVIDITAEPQAAPVIIKPTWRRLRLNVEVQGGAGMMFDVRLGSDTSGESILRKGPQPLNELGEAGVLIPDEYEGKEVCLVVHPPHAPQDVRARLAAVIEG
ncbi:MAG: BREX-1 system phosphatase PglZ type B [Alphaproteobacteria bacterium]|nr:BREX-1 system phosphatase PglZ type B [Alphaproteobacteria bacterium]